MSGVFATVLAMRFLHTSDWHLGRSLHRADLREAQSGFVDHLVETVRSERVDAVLVAGDIYDRAIPPVDAVALYEEALARLRAAGARVILISGNHDSARRLGVNAALVDAAGVHLRTRPAALADPVLLADADGPVAVYGIPYLEPLQGTHESVLGDALTRIRADAAARGVPRTVVLAHAWVAGGASAAEREQDAESRRSASERDISVGGIGYVPARLFDGLGYAALGHLHGRQTLAGHLRYSGSPLPYSFSEKDQQKGSWLVELTPGRAAGSTDSGPAGGTVRADWVPAPVYRRLTALSGSLADLLADRAHAPYENDFLAVTLTDPVRPEGAMDRLRARFPHILTLEFRPPDAPADPRSYGQKVRGRDDLAVAAEFVRHVRRTDASDPERALLSDAFTAVRQTGAVQEKAGH
jgi:exonuclease SbcD